MLNLKLLTASLLIAAVSTTAFANDGNNTYIPAGNNTAEASSVYHQLANRAFQQQERFGYDYKTLDVAQGEMPNAYKLGTSRVVKSAHVEVTSRTAHPYKNGRKVTKIVRKEALPKTDPAFLR